jgi:hypothetical protein
LANNDFPQVYRDIINTNQFLPGSVSGSLLSSEIWIPEKNWSFQASRALFRRNPQIAKGLTAWQ